MNNLEENRMLLLEDFNFWSNRFDYVELMKRLKNGIVSIEDFHDQFCHMLRLDRDKVSQWDDLKGLEVDRLKGFSSLMSELFFDCDVFELDPLLRDSFSISGEELRISVFYTLSEIETRYP